MKALRRATDAPDAKNLKKRRAGTVDMTFRRLWHEDTPTARERLLLCLLLPLSLIYRSVVFQRNGLFDLGVLKQQKMKSPVISVGNLTVGGTGKTPLVIMLANFLRDNGYRPAVLSRGYRSSSSAAINVVSDGKTILMGHADGGDEPVLIARSSPGTAVLTGANRILTGKRAADQLGADILILDDGFQHRHVARDVNILLMDRSRPFGNGFLLPAGPLREPPGAARRADLIVFVDSNGGGARDFFPDGGIPFKVPVFRGIRRPKDVRRGGAEEVFPLSILNKTRVYAFSGIGSPQSFRKTLNSLGAEVAGYLTFPDHYRYRREDLHRIEKAAAGTASSMIVTTEKDGVNLEDFPFFLNKVSFLRIAMEIVPNEEAFHQWLRGRLDLLGKKIHPNKGDGIVPANTDE
jgi:tetraacyldisaccharide 4'-kinase